MQKIINSLATITYCKDFDGIEIAFSKAGDLLQYDDTMDLALNMARLNQCNNWVIVKESFRDINIEEFLLFISNWILNGTKSKAAEQIKSKCKIVLITQKEIRAKIKSKFNYLTNNTLSARQIDFRIFDGRKEALQFMKQGFLPLFLNRERKKVEKEGLANIEKVHN